jgi:hypothetical protein
MERHDGAITCREVGRVVSQSTTGGDLNLRRSSSHQPTQTDTTMYTLRTLILAVLAGGTAGLVGLMGFVVLVFAGTALWVEVVGLVIAVLVGWVELMGFIGVLEGFDVVLGGLAATLFGVAFVPADCGGGDEATMLGVAFAFVD